MRRKTLENLKVPLAAPREATVRGICYFTDLSGKQISSSLRPSVAAAPWTLPELTATPHQCPGMSHHHPGPQPQSCGGQLNPLPGGRVNGQTSSCPSPGRTYGFFPAFFPSCTSFPGRATAKGALAALGKTSSRSNPISDGGKHFSRERHRCRHGPSLSLPPTAFPATGRSSSWRGRSQRQAAHGKYRLPELWEHLEAWAGLVRGTTRAACPSCPSSAPPEGGKLQVHPVTTWCLAPTSLPAGCVRRPAVFPEPRALRVQGEESARRTTVRSSGSARGGSGRRALGVIPLTSVPWRVEHVFCHPNRTIGLSGRLTPTTANGTKRCWSFPKTQLETQAGTRA